MDPNKKKSVSQSLLSCGHGGGLNEKLLLKPKTCKSFQTERVPRSSVLERLQTFLPEMAEANRTLTQQIENAPAGTFDIENVEEAEKVIEMDFALVELSGSDDDSEVETSDSEEESADDNQEITEQNIKLPGGQGKKQNVIIQVLQQEHQ